MKIENDKEPASPSPPTIIAILNILRFYEGPFPVYFWQNNVCACETLFKLIKT